MKIEKVKCSCGKDLKADYNLYRINETKFKCPYCGIVTDIDNILLNAIPVLHRKKIAIVYDNKIIFQAKESEVLETISGFYINVPRVKLKAGSKVYYLEDDYSFEELEESLKAEITK